MDLQPSGVTVLLDRLRDGDRAAFDELLPVVYQELRRIAAGHLRHERVGHTLQPTSLVHEAYMKLLRNQEMTFESRAHFLRVASRVMRQILVDYARARGCVKRGAGAGPPVDLDESQVAAECPLEPLAIIELDRALGLLDAHDSRMAQLMEMRYFGGMSAEEIAEALTASVHSIRHDMRYAHAWLRREMAR